MENGVKVVHSVKRILYSYDLVFTLLQRNSITMKATEAEISRLLVIGKGQAPETPDHTFPMMHLNSIFSLDPPCQKPTHNKT